MKGMFSRDGRQRRPEREILGVSLFAIVKYCSKLALGRLLRWLAFSVGNKNLPCGLWLKVAVG
jgi:hypothetical protein